MYFNPLYWLYRLDDFSLITKVYKIRNKKTGLYSTGGTSPKFTKSGKTWSQLSHLKNHLNQAIVTIWKRDGNSQHVKLQNDFDAYRDCEIVTYKIVQEEEPNPPFELMEFFSAELRKKFEQKQCRTDMFNTIVMINLDGSRESREL